MIDDAHRYCGCPHGFPCGARVEPNCFLCGTWLGRQMGEGTHYNCRRALQFAITALLHSLVAAGSLQLAFDLGFYNTECANVHPSVNWLPGCGRAAP